MPNPPPRTSESTMPEHAAPYTAWCLQRGVTHAHCPDGCEHPQPFVDATGTLLCGRCAAVYGERTAMVPCLPEVCGDD
jgi:hypothetical protein